MSPEQTATRADWEAVLTALEQDAAGLPAAAAADAGSAAVVGWSEPAGLGPIPRELVGRASRLLAAQRDAIAALEASRRSASSQIGALRAVDATREPRGSVYLDASA